jgi:hypothetical protein
LPDGLFSNQKFQFGQSLEVLRWKNVAIFYGHLEYFTDIWDILYFMANLVHFVFIWYIFSGFGVMNQEKSGNPDPTVRVFLFVVDTKEDLDRDSNPCWGTDSAFFPALYRPIVL